MTEFTKGTWTLNPETAIISAHTIGAGKPDKKLIATVFGASFRSVDDNTEALANARLIENAPAMYYLLDHIAHELRETRDDDKWLEMIDNLLAIDKLLARIDGDCEKNAPALKPCPFCSSENAYVANYGEKIAIECPNCDCSTKLCDTMDEAADAWNMRGNNSERIAEEYGE